MSHHPDQLMQCLEYTEMSCCYPHYRQCKQADLPLIAPASLDAWYAQRCHRCCDEGPRKELPGRRAPNIVSSCASEQLHFPLKTVLDEFQLAVYQVVLRLKLEALRARQQHCLFEVKQLVGSRLEPEAEFQPFVSFCL